MNMRIVNVVGARPNFMKMAPLVAVGPLGHLDSLGLMAGAKLALTDSGGIQEEITVPGIPCLSLTVRETADRPVTVKEGTSTILGTASAKIVSGTRKDLAGYYKSGGIPKYWDGKAATRIVDSILEHPPTA